MADKYPSVVVTGKLAWAFIGDKVNDMSGKYQVDVSNLSGEDANKLTTIGLRPRQEDPNKIKERLEAGKEAYDRGLFITAKSSKPYFKIKNPDGTDFTGDANSIGNGTEARVKIVSVPYDFKGKRGNTCGIDTVVIYNLVTYTKQDSQDNKELYAEAPNRENLFD